MRFAKHHLALATAAMLAATAATPAAAEGPSSTTITIRAVVHTICTVDVQGGSSAMGVGTVDLGEMTQLCNNPDGYTIKMRHGTGLVGARAIIDGRTVPLSPTGETVLIDSNHAAYARQRISIELAENTPVTTLSLSIQPKGMVY